LQAAVQHNCQSVALPSLSTGAYGYPVARAARTALQAVVTFLAAQRQPALVRFVLFDTDTYDSYAAALQEVMANGRQDTTPAACQERGDAPSRPRA
jgi:O-acetyl-ADP-ribose deacetylase (regulator of RNase III)